MKSKSINPSREKIRDLLKTSYFKVPPFQRGYSWSIRNWGEFWEDLNKHSSEDFDFFLGSIVVKPTKEDICEVIDGQQRLATTLIFLSVVRDILKEKGDLDSKNIQKDFIYYKETYKPERPKLKLNKQDNSFFQKHIIKEDNPMVEVKNRGLKEGEKNLMKAYKFFYKQLQNSTPEVIQNITVNLLDCTYVILIEVQDDIQAYIVFETLNSRGEDLSASDLIKNSIFTHANKEDLLDEVSSLWDEMRVNLGDLKSTIFIRNYITSINEHGIVREKDLFRFIKSKKLIENNVEEFTRKLKEEAKNYSEIFEPTIKYWNDKEIINYLKGINILKLKTCYPLLLSISSSKFKTPEKKELIKLIEKLGFRYSIILKKNPNHLEIKYAEWSYKIRQVETLANILDDIKDTMPNDEEFYHGFLEKTETNNQIARYILKKVWEPNLTGLLEIVDNVTLEHILPESIIKWKQYIEENNELVIDDKKVSVEQFAKGITYKLGNMTFLLPKDNSKLGNESFEQKKKKVFSDSGFSLNLEIAKEKIWSLK